MDRIQFLMFLIATLTASSFAEDEETASTLENKSLASELRNPRVSSEFGYRVQNPDSASSHFRQEHRDLNGVVRGSYGFTNPDGVFRLVQYVADDKGYRAHISSNEHGIGRQNPASVSINRFQQQNINEHITSFKAPVSSSRRQNLGQEGSHAEEQFARYDMYSPVQASHKTGLNENRNFEFPFLQDRGFHRATARRPAFQSMFQQNPVEKFLNTRFDVPRDILSLFNKNGHGHISQPTMQFHPIQTDHFQHPLAQVPKGNEHDPAVKINITPSMTEFLENLHTSGVLPEDNTGSGSKVSQEDISVPGSELSKFLYNILPNPHHKVHTSLPDCNSVTSAVLCKPPDFLSGIYFQRNSTKVSTDFPFLDNIQTAESGRFSPEIKRESLEAPSLSSIFDMYQRSDKIYPPGMMTNSDVDIYRGLFGHKPSEGIMDVRHDRKCYKNHFAPDGTTSNYFPPFLHSKHHINGDLGNILTNYNQNRKEKPISENKGQHFETSNMEDDYYSTLVKVIQNDHSLNKLKDLLLSNTQSSTDPASMQTPKLSLLGILILPSQIVKELNSNNFNDSSVKKIIKNEERNRTLLVEDIPRSDVIDQTHEYLDESKFKLPVKGLDQESNSRENNSVPSLPNAINETYSDSDGLQSEVPHSWRNQLITAYKNKMNLTEFTISIKSQPFHVFNTTVQPDTEEDKNNPEHGGKGDRASNTSSENWRKILEDEISKEIDRTVLQQEARFPEVPADIPSVPEIDNKTNQRQYTLNKHSGPLYDSTGRPIKPENVPIHIHRYIPPTGIPPLPWKFTIPRPAPPRSIIVPPKPPVLS